MSEQGKRSCISWNDIFVVMSSPSDLLRNQRNREKSNKGNPHTLASSKKNRARARNIARQLRRNNSPATVAARAAKLKRDGREIPTHVEPRVIEQKERPTPTQHHTRTHTPQAKHVCTRPTPPRTHRTTTEQRKPTHDYTHSELAERACKGAPQWKNQMWGPNQQLPRSQSGQSVSRVLGLVKCCGRVWVWVGHVHTKRRQKARARPPGGPVESRNSHARRAESDRTKRKTNTNTTPHTHAYTPSQTRVYTPTPPRTHRTTTEQRKPTHDYTHSELAERAPQWKNQMWGPNQQLPLSQSGQSVSLVLGFGKCVTYDYYCYLYFYCLYYYHYDFSFLSLIK